MRVVLLLVAALSLAAPSGAQNAPPSAPATGTPSSPAAAPDGDLPVSLDRIRDGLTRGTDPSILRNIDRRPDFTIQVEEQARIDAILSKLDFRSGPAPAGGIYMFEQQQRLFRSTRPLQQPYAAFNGGQLLTIALQNLIGRYVAGQARDALSSAGRSRAEREAREEVDQSIAEFCASRPDRQAIQLCTEPPAR